LLDSSGGAGNRAAEDVEEAVSTFLDLRHDEVVSRLLAGAEAHYEVPFSLKWGAGREVVRGAIDCLAFLSPSEAVVFEIKTGRPAPWHRAQLDLYLAAARQLFPGTTVTGMLVYPDGTRLQV